MCVVHRVVSKGKVEYLYDHTTRSSEALHSATMMPHPMAPSDRESLKEHCSTDCSKCGKYRDFGVIEMMLTVRAIVPCRRRSAIIKILRLS